MKACVSILFILWAFFGINAKECPPEWLKYTSGGFFYDIQHDQNNRNLSETDFKNKLLDIARVSLAKQIKVSIRDVADIDKKVINGNSTIKYSSLTSLSTDIDMALVETRTLYDSYSKEGYAIAYIDKEAARYFYINELTRVSNKIKNNLALADSYVESGFKKKAEGELEESQTYFSSVDESLFWLNIFGASQSTISNWQQDFSLIEQTIKQKLAELKHSTRIYLSCEADIFGTPYPKLENEVKGLLAADGCSFVDLPDKADWSIKITCSAEQHNIVKIGNVNSYFTYVNAHIIIEKTATSQRIYEDEISVKGGHNLGYGQAAKKAYNEIKEQLGKTIKEVI